MRLPLTALALVITIAATSAAAGERPNILIAISDDQSFAHTSFAGYPAVSTPHFDRVASSGVFFENAIAASPGCSPSRAALLTGRHTWQIEEAGTHASSFPAKYRTFVELLQEAGYTAGHTGKGWGPGNYELEGRTENPAGPGFHEKRLVPPTNGINKIDYAGNFEDFLAQRDPEQPFLFWYGAKEPHRKFEKGSYLAAQKSLSDATPPSFLPDHPEIRADLADYCVEIEWFDQHLGKMLAMLEASGELENTIVIVTSDNGMAFPRAKANVYEYGVHVPLAIMWNAQIPPNRIVKDVVGFVDLTATIFDLSGTAPPQGELALSGASLRELLLSDRQGLTRPDSFAYAARERHSSSRYNNLSYPQRALRTSRFLYIKNFAPERWPAGDPVQLDDEGKPLGPHSGYTDIDRCPSQDLLLAGHDTPGLSKYFHLAVDKRPAEELYDILNDPGCLHNLADKETYAATRRELRAQLEGYLLETGDPRQVDGGDIWETYPRYSPMRTFPPHASGSDQ
ncbi:sulfatase [Pelagicoccus sp. SDUM812005]|uniref:sulfatase family protein n=1 Tax=Pelagicoccus sp. SDUM812005 TaxID=3041257 RepID=UPI00281006C8|nr:sulfatase [Pelagicoccus sp. SDUM812005]MDQ8181434.1 sulfatase [Pelagicoccus sp. SDUM812005]